MNAPEMSACETRRVEIGSVEVLPDGESFVLGLVDANRELHRMELPSWAVHQLLRILPRVDGALAQAREDFSARSARSAA